MTGPRKRLFGRVCVRWIREHVRRGKHGSAGREMAWKCGRKRRGDGWVKWGHVERAKDFRVRVRCAWCGKWTTIAADQLTANDRGMFVIPRKCECNADMDAVLSVSWIAVEEAQSA